MLLTIAAAVALSLQPEVGAVHMPSAPDDFWYEQGLPHTTDFDSFAFGLSGKLDYRKLSLSLGWRDLGNQHQHGQIMGDAAYFACAGHGACVGHANQWWDMTGAMQQTYLEAGWTLHLARLGVDVVPAVGIARTTLSSHVNMYSYPSMSPRAQSCRTGRESSLTPFYGVSIRRGPVGVGVEWLDTGVDRSGNDCTSPIQGSSAAYLRITYAFSILGTR